MALPTKATVITGVVCVVGGLAVGRFSLPTKVVVRTVVQTRQIVVHQDHVITKVVTVKEPNGAVQTTTTTQDLSTTTSHVQSDSDSSKTVTYTKPSWLVGAMAGVDVPGRQTGYGAFAERRVLGPLYLGGYGLSTGQTGVSLGVQF